MAGDRIAVAVALIGLVVALVARRGGPIERTP